MASTLPVESASTELLSCILEGSRWPDYLLRRALTEDEGRTLFSVVIESLGDLFEPALCDEYARLFTRVVELLRPEWKAVDLLNRYERVRKVRPCTIKAVDTVTVLSRVTLGADIAVTSVILDAVKKRFPQAQIRFAGPRKNYELFAEDERVRHVSVEYPRSGSIVERLAHWSELSEPGGIVVDPDSRLTQLGILPVCEEDTYFFFESRAYGADTADTLPQLASRWAQEVFDHPGCAYLRPTLLPMEHEVAVSFGVGENPDKRIAGSFEEDLLRSLADRGMSVIVDEGGGGEEADRVRELHRRVPRVDVYKGSFAGFAAKIVQAGLYVGYDSAGQHVAAAAGTPLVSVFAGYRSDRMFERWKPWGPGVREIVKVTQDQEDLAERTTEAINRVTKRMSAKERTTLQ